MPKVVEHCRLCGEFKRLCHSHILPEFLYLGLYDEKHSAIAIKPKVGSSEDVIQKGLREFLLCQTCETQFSRYELYAAKILKQLPDVSTATPGELLFVEPCEYARFKLFQMSLIWRMGIARQPSFGEIRLGPHEESLRGLLRKEDPSDPLVYCCALISMRGPGRADQVLKFPLSHRMNGHRVYVALFGGLWWAFVVSGHSVDMTETRSFISSDNRLPINVSSQTVPELWAGIASGLKKLGLA